MQEVEADLVDRRIPGSYRQPPKVKMPGSQPKNDIHKLQFKKHLFTMASGEQSGVRAANITVVDQDMEDWFKELFDNELTTKPNFNPSIAHADDVASGMVPPRGIEPRSYSLRDIDQKSLYLQDKNLVAAPLQGDNSVKEEILSVLPNRSLDRKRFPLILSVKGGSQGISCGKEDQPKLQLEDTNLINLFTDVEEAKRFTFFKSYDGSTHMFESATHPGWFLCSPAEAHQPLRVTSHTGGSEITNFYFQQISTGTEAS